MAGLTCVLMPHFAFPSLVRCAGRHVRSDQQHPRLRPPGLVYWSLPIS